MICKKHNIEKIQLWGKNIFVCPECEKQRKKEASDKLIQKNRALMAQSHGNRSKEPKNALKSKKDNTESNPMNTADTWFSRLVKIKKGIIRDGDVYCKDIIGGKYYKSTRIDNGHYFGRGNMSLRYELDNCWPQNKSSNRFSGDSDKPKFKRNVIDIIGLDRFNELETLSHAEFHYSHKELEDLSDKFRNEVNELVKLNNIKKWWQKH